MMKNGQTFAIKQKCCGIETSRFWKYVLPFSIIIPGKVKLYNEKKHINNFINF